MSLTRMNSLQPLHWISFFKSLEASPSCRKTSRMPSSVNICSPLTRKYQDHALINDPSTSDSMKISGVCASSALTHTFLYGGEERKKKGRRTSANNLISTHTLESKPPRVSMIESLQRLTSICTSPLVLICARLLFDFLSSNGYMSWI